MPRIDVTDELMFNNYKINEEGISPLDGKYRVSVYRKDAATDVYIGCAEAYNGVWRIKSEHGFESSHLKATVKKLIEIYIKFNMSFLELRNEFK